MAAHFRIGITADFKVGVPGRLDPVLTAVFDPLPNIEYEYFDFTGQDELGKHVAAADIATYDAILSLGVRFPPAAFANNPRLAVLSRWGRAYLFAAESGGGKSTLAWALLHHALGLRTHHPSGSGQAEGKLLCIRCVHGGIAIAASRTAQLAIARERHRQARAVQHAHHCLFAVVIAGDAPRRAGKRL